MTASLLCQKHRSAALSLSLEASSQVKACESVRAGSPDDLLTSSTPP